MDRYLTRKEKNELYLFKLKNNLNYNVTKLNSMESTDDSKQIRHLFQKLFLFS